MRRNQAQLEIKENERIKKLNDRMDQKDERSRFVILKTSLSRAGTLHDVMDEHVGLKMANSAAGLRSNAVLPKQTDDLTALHYQNFLHSGVKKVTTGGTIDSDVASAFQRTISNTEGTQESPERSPPHSLRPATAQMYGYQKKARKQK